MDLLDLSAMNQPSCRRCAFERDRAEQKTCECGCDMRLFAGGLDGESESGLPVDTVGGKRMSSLFSRVSPTTNPVSLLGHCFGGKTDALRHGGFCFFWTPPPSWNAPGSPLQKMHPWHLGVGPTR
jgi:hypothetical protein